MLRIRNLSVGLLVVALCLAGPAGAAVKMYSGKWVADAFGNDKVGGTGESQFFNVLNNPQGILCNGGIPVCPFAFTPTNGLGVFNVFGPSCAPLSTFMTVNGAGGFAGRPTAKGKTVTTGGMFVSTAAQGLRDRTPPLYRNTAFFLPNGQPNNATDCSSSSTISGAMATKYLSPFDAKRGLAQAGAPLTGTVMANVDTAMASLPFTFAAAPLTPPGGIRRTTLGSFSNMYPYLYSYTYRTLRNGAANFKRGGGFFTTMGAGTFVLPYKQGANTVGKAVIKAGANRFGGTMRLLGPDPSETLTSTVTGNGSQGKVCYFNGGGCSLGGFDWRYRFAGTFSVVGKGTKGWAKSAKFASITATDVYYNTAGMQSSLVNLEGWRFPWTTGAVTVSATVRPPDKIFMKRKGFDKRTSKGGGSIQLVTPLVTRWLQPSTNFETSGVAVMRLPEPHKWALLVAGLSLLGLLYRARGR